MGEEDQDRRLDKLEQSMYSFVEFRAEVRTGLFLLKWMTGVVLTTLMIILTYLGYNEARRNKNTAVFSDEPSYHASVLTGR
jgi:hypothetical protein